MIIILKISEIILFLYFLLISAYTIGWFFNKKVDQERSTNGFISVIIAYRNEQNNLHNLLNGLIAQTYPKNKYEVILVNDHSTDKSFKICQEYSEKFYFIKNYNLEKKAGKKHALDFAIKKASGKLILTTDADCLHKQLWVKTFNDFFHKTNAKMIIAPVVYKTTPKLLSFANFQALEFLSLIGTTGGSAGLKYPLMCNGANLCFEKKEYFQLINPLNNKITSGDDVFLMLNIRKKSKNNVKFIRDKNAIVTTYAEKNLKQFFHQRIRWASKTKNYKNLYIPLVGFLVFVLNLIPLFLLISSMFFNINFIYFFGFIILKTIIDLPMLYVVSKFSNNLKLLFLAPFLQLFYFFYVSIIGVFSVFKGFEWKDRKYFF